MLTAVGTHESPGKFQWHAAMAAQLSHGPGKPDGGRIASKRLALCDGLCGHPGSSGDADIIAQQDRRPVGERGTVHFDYGERGLNEGLTGASIFDVRGHLAGVTRH